MERLTREQLENYRNTYDRYEGIESSEFERICDELIEYKSLEEELGIDLIILFKALKEGVWFSFKNMKTESFSVKYKNKKHHIIPKLKVYQNAVGAINWYLEIAHKNWSYNYFLYPEYYGKTWSLDRSELENE